MAKHVRHFKTMAEMIDRADVREDFGDEEGSSRTGDKRFTGSRDWAHARSLVFRWDEGAERIGAMRTKIALGAEQIVKESFRRGYAPGTLLMGAYVNGHPKPYISKRRTDDTQKGAGKVMRIVFNCAASAGVDKQILERRGAATLALVDSLERKGVRVEVVVAMAITETDDWECRTVVKRASQRLNLNSVAFAVAHPSMLRRVIFSLMESEPKNIRDNIGVTYGGYGMPAEADHKPTDIYIGRAFYGEPQWDSDESAARWVVDQLREQGIIK